MFNTNRENITKKQSKMMEHDANVCYSYDRIEVNRMDRDV